MLKQQNLFVSGDGGYHTYRIPAIVVSTRGTLLAFCEGRRNGAADDGDIDLLLRRSYDGGETWRETQLVYDDGDNTVGNPAPVVIIQPVPSSFCSALTTGRYGLPQAKTTALHGVRRRR